MTIEIHYGSGNVYADLQFPNAEAMQAKAQLVALLGQVCESEKAMKELAKQAQVLDMGYE